jgi:hypothetical protein
MDFELENILSRNGMNYLPEANGDSNNNASDQFLMRNMQRLLLLHLYYKTACNYRNVPENAKYFIRLNKAGAVEASL